jgi:hypothetical protein
MRVFVFIAIVIVSVSCSRKTESIHLKVSAGNDKAMFINKINLVEDSLTDYYKLMVNNRVDSLPSKMIQRTIELYENFYHTFPTDSLAPIYLDKIHQLHMQEKRYSYAVNWVDTLLLRFPNYTNKAEILYSAATTSDLYLLDTNRVKRYYNKMLVECPKLKSSVKNEIKRRLSNLNLTYLDYLKISSSAH